MMIADFVTEQPPSAALGDLSDMFEPESLRSPIDMYQTRIVEILGYGTPARLTEGELLGRLLALSVVSAAEAYFRAILSSCIEICPTSQSIASEKTINLGGMLWHGRIGFSRSAFDHVSFASADDLRKTTMQYIGLKLADTTFQAPLSEYDKVCHLRHGIVHNDGLLPGRNAVKLNIRRMNGAARIRIDYRRLQEIAAVTTTLVATYNREIFAILCKRWAVDWRSRADWKPSDEASLFNKIWELSISKLELNRRPNRAKLRRIDCMEAVRHHYDLL